MWIISKKRLREFWTSPRGKGSKSQLEAWYQVVTHARWEQFADAKRTYGASADLVGDCVVFDIAGNKFRLVTRIRFQSHRVFILKLMPHSEYDRDNWKTECGCYMAASSGREATPQEAKPVLVRRKRQ
jgi:mRNA interferase HigB